MTTPIGLPGGSLAIPAIGGSTFRSAGGMCFPEPASALHVHDSILHKPHIPS